MEKVKTFFVTHKDKFKMGVAFILGGLAAIKVPVPEFVPVFLAAIGLH